MSETTAIAAKAASLARRPGFKAIGVALLAFAMIVPLGLVAFIVAERQARAHGFPKLMGQYKGGRVMNSKVPAQLESRVPLGTIHEDRNGQEVIPDRELSAREDRVGCNRKLPFTRLALENLPGLVGVALGAITMGTNRLPACLYPANAAEGIIRLVVRHAGHFGQCQRPRFR